MSHSNHIFISPSSEFLTLCQTQISLLSQGLGATWSAVYLTEGLVEGTEPKLMPVAVYPQKARGWQQEQILPEVIAQIETAPRLITPTGSNNLTEEEIRQQTDEMATWQYLERGQQQIILPLIYEELFMGLLVTVRDKREWNEVELQQIKKIAHTLAIACLLDQRQGWYQEQLNQAQKRQQLAQNRLDDLLHQLRNPLTALRTFSKLLLKRLLPEDRNQTVAQSMLRESEHLQELLQQFEAEIDVIETETTALLFPSPLPSLSEALPPKTFLLPGNNEHLESVSISEILDPLVLSGQAIAQEKNLNLQYQTASNLTSVQANTKALREVLGNLIDNAIKYTPDGGNIDIKTGLEQGQFQGIAIADTGYGIPTSDQEYLFQRHYRGVQAQGNIPGTGLGLAIAKELIEQMQGKIEVISPNHLSKNQQSSLPGTTFIVWLLKAINT